MSRRSWRLSALCVEAVRNVFNAGSRLRLVALFVIGVGSALSLFALYEWRQLESDVKALQRDGWSVYIIGDVAGEVDGGIAASSCSRLSSSTEVTSVAGIAERALEQFTQLGPRTVPIVTVGMSSSQHDLRNTAPTTESIPVMASDELVGSLNGARRLTNRYGTSYDITRRLPDELALAGLSGSLVVPVPLERMTGDVQECVVTVAPWSDGNIGARLASSVSARTLQLSTRQVHSIGSHPYDRFLDRTGTVIFPAVGIVVAVVIGLSMRSRASELGVYRISGTSRTALMVLLGLENFLILGCWAFSAATASLVIERLSDLPTTASWVRQLLALGTCSAVAACFAVISALRDVTTMLKDR